MMKGFLILVISALAFTCLTAMGTPSQNNQPPTLQSEIKIKAKDGKMIGRDKSKPVRRAIEAWYERNIEAFMKKDVAAIMALRTEDFHTVTPDGKVNTRADMEARTKLLVGRIDHFISQDFQIGTIEVQGELASAEVTQKTVRMQRLQDGKLLKVEAKAVQRETWKKLDGEWKLYRVDNVQDAGLFVDDKPYKPGQ
jgi:ketosteroid isomerase-like protein